MTVFLDTVGLLSLWDASDQWHAAAAQAHAIVVAQRATLVTTTYILLATGNSAARRPCRNDVDDLRRLLEETDSLIEPTREDWRLAREAFARGDAASADIADHVSFVVMRRLNIREALTNDRHFVAAGFVARF